MQPIFNLVIRTDDCELHSLAEYQRLYATVEETKAGKANVLQGGWIGKLPYTLAAFNNQKCISKAMEEVSTAVAQHNPRRSVGTPVVDMRDYVVKFPHVPTDCSAFERAFGVIARTHDHDFHSLAAYDRVYAVEKLLDVGKIMLLLGGWLHNDDCVAIACCTDRGAAVACIDAIVNAVARGPVVADLREHTYVPPAEVLAKIGA